MPCDAGALDPEGVEEQEETGTMGCYGVFSIRRCVATAEPQEIDDDYTVSRRKFRDYSEPQMTRCGESVDEKNRLASSARSAGIVVKPLTGQVHEFAAHAPKRATCSPSGEPVPEVITNQRVTAMPLANRVILAIVTRL